MPAYVKLVNIAYVKQQSGPIHNAACQRQLPNEEITERERFI